MFQPLTVYLRVSILVTFTIYAVAGRELFKKRRQLRAFNTFNNLNPYDSFKTTDVQVTSELATLEAMADVIVPSNGKNPSQRSPASGTTYERYSVNIMSSPMTSRPSAPHTSMVSMQNRKNKAAMEANRAAWGYTKVAILFFASLLVTWVSLPLFILERRALLNVILAVQLPSSINRVYALAHPHNVPDSYEYAAGIVLSLMGFWNSVIYIMTSRAACKALIRSIFLRRSDVEEITAKRISDDRSTMNQGSSVSADTLTGSSDRLAVPGAVL